MQAIQKEELISKLKDIKAQGWILNTRKGNDGSVGNILEDLLGIEENNLPIPNSAEWELKCQRKKTKSMPTLFHTEPSPRALKLVPSLLLPKYGWKHKKAGKEYPETEKSFRQTICTKERSDRGFKVVVDRKERKVLISFDASVVSPKHKEWFDMVVKNAGKEELNPQPYWGFDDLFHHAGTKLHNCFYILADTKTEKRKSYFKYEDIHKLAGLSLEKFIDAIENGDVYIDFDARTGHNHGTKIRAKNAEVLKSLYSQVEII